MDQPDLTHTKELESQNTAPATTASRRALLKLGAAASVAAGAAGIAPSAAASNGQSSGGPSQASIRRRIRQTYSTRLRAARRNMAASLEADDQEVNDDDLRYSSENYYAAFTKTLPHDNFGEVDPAAYEALQAAARSGRTDRYDLIPLDPTAARKLANPQGAYRLDITGLDGHFTRINEAHRFRSPDIAGEMVEVYWQAICRDVPFINYGSDASVAAAIADLNNLSVIPGEEATGPASVQTLFRGETPGDIVGPYISQLLWLPFSFGSVDVEQRYETGSFGVDYMTTLPNWLNILRGGAPLEAASFDATKRYIFDNRSLGEYVHRDVLYQAYLHATLILLGYGGAALDEGNPYVSDITNQGAFTSLGGPFIIDMVSKAANLSLQGAWYQKWLHRFLRPEVLSGRVHYHITGDRTYELHDDVLNSQAVSTLLSNNGNALLPMGYIEGSPTHPSYPAGHATIAGACVTVLKAFFNEDFVIPNPVEANATGDSLLNWTGADLTIGGELNKLANNIAIGRDAAGVHYRQDGVQGLFGGEQQAIMLLQDYTSTLSERNFGGFTLTRFDGTTIRISRGRVFEL